MSNNYLLHKKSIIIFGACFLIVLCFAYSVFIRRSWFGRPLDTHHEWLTAHSVCVTKNWIKEGAINLRFMHILNPASIEFGTLLSRDPYVSYPPGTFIPVFLLAKIFNIKDLITLYQAYNLFNHLIISLILFLIMFQTVCYFRDISIFLIFFSIIPSIIYLYTPPTLYWHQNVFFADQAVIMLFIVFVYLEMKHFLYGRLNKWNELFFVFIVFLGTLTEWLFIYIVFVAFTLRILFKLKPMGFKQVITSNLNLIIPTLLTIILFFYQIFSIGSFNMLFDKFLVRSGLEMREYPIVVNFLDQHFKVFGVRGYGKILCLSAAFCVLAFLFYYILIRLKVIRGNINDKMLDVYLYLICLSILPCLLQVYTFQPHSIAHDFSALKWAVPLSLIPFGIMPIILSQLIKNHKYHNSISWVMSFVVLILLIKVFNLTFTNYKNFFSEGSSYNKKIGELVKRNTTYNDICFSFDFEIPVFPPQRLAYSEKRVYRINNFIGAEIKVSQFAKRGAVGKIFISDKVWANLTEEEKKICSKIYKDEDYYICEMVKFK